jgi:hypothetical protein
MDLRTARALREELEAFVASVHVQAPGEGIGIGIATTEMPGRYSIAVRARTAEFFPPNLVDELRRRTAGEIDIRITGPVAARLPANVVTSAEPVPPPRARQRPEIRFGGTRTRGATTTGARLQIGASVGHYRISGGTLGCFARRNADGALGIVSNNHVLAAEDRGVDGDVILHPAFADRGTTTNNVIAALCGDYPRLSGGTAGVDCAFALLRTDLQYDPVSLQMGYRLRPVAAPEDGQRAVAKVGRSTLRTHGRIISFELTPVDVYYGLGVVRFTSQIEIESSSPTPFSRPGDSGSVIFGTEGNALGLLYANSAVGGAWKSGLTYAHPLNAVLNALGVTLLT